MNVSENLSVCVWELAMIAPCCGKRHTTHLMTDAALFDAAETCILWMRC